MTIIIPGLYGLDSASAWRTFSKDPQKYLNRVASDKTVKREIEYFNKVAPNFKNVDELVKDRRALQYLLNAYGLGAEINNVGRIKKILTEDPTGENALVNKLIEPKYKAMASSLRLDQGMDKLQRLSFRDTISEKYIQNEFEVSLGDQDNALRQAAYFARSANSIADVYSILGDKVLRDVVQNVYNLPSQLAIQPVETQARAISSRVDVKKFLNGASTSVSNSQLTNAKSDHTLIQTNLGISDAARNQVKALQDQLSQLVTDYGNLAAITDPGGDNAATIAVQQTSVPQIVGFEQSLRAGNAAIDSVSTIIGNLSNLVTQAGVSGSDINALKAQFTDMVDSISDALNNAGVVTPDGSTQNIMMNGTDDTVSATLNVGGTTITINRYDGAALLGVINNAKTAFDAVSGSGDEANLTTAQSRLLNAADRATAINAKLEGDFVSLIEKGDSTLFAATLNTTELLNGKQSIDGALDRIGQIEDLLVQISQLATTSKNRAPGADRSDLEASFLDYRTQIRDLITNSGVGLDNLLNNAPATSYEISSGQNFTVKPGYDLLSSIADVLDAGSLSDETAAAALENTVILVTKDSDKLKSSLSVDQEIIGRTLGTYDPRGRLDSKVLELQSTLEELVAGAAVNGVNLLDAEQGDIKLNGLSTGNILTFRAQPNFLSTIQTAFTDAIAQFANGATAVNDVLSDLLDTVDRVKSNMDMDNRKATMEYGRLGAVIDALEPTTATEGNTTYKVNAFTEKFIQRYLTLAGGSGNTGGNSYLLTLLGGNTGNGGFGMNTAFGTLSSLSMKV
jgi:hypothetical protein